VSSSSPAPGNGNGDSVFLGAVDLGSNSFHMIVARAGDHGLTLLDRLREPVRLASGLGKGDLLDEETEERALACLRRFGERLHGFPPSRVRAVGTNTFRKLDRSSSFRARASEALGVPIEIISGSEEARLIYLGIQYAMPDDRLRLAMDIGGGSTEVIVGQGARVRRTASLFMGCVSYSQRFFPDGVITRDAFRAAETAAGVELRTVREGFRRLGWETVAGASGTINAVADLLRRNGLDGPRISRARLKDLRSRLVAAGHVDALELDGLKKDRAPVLPGGLAILIEAFRALGIEEMDASSGALREGVLQDLHGRLHEKDVRDLTIQGFMDRYQIDGEHAARVERTARQFLAASGPTPGLEDGPAGMLLSWAARLHEVGLAVSYAGHHRHGAYLVANSDLPGFSFDDQAMLAALVGLHRRKLRDTMLNDVPAARREATRRLTVLLRLAVLMHRSRGPSHPPTPEFDWSNGSLHLAFRPELLRRHPLTRADLREEATYLQSWDLKLVVDPSPDADGAAPPDDEGDIEDEP
jgi:exopolyphosphatase/guanosine-5'-triphosphate,3'-diphosphate pyrophosphatase